MKDIVLQRIQICLHILLLLLLLLLHTIDKALFIIYIELLYSAVHIKVIDIRANV